MYKRCKNKINVRNISTTIINDSYSESSYLLEEIRFLFFIVFKISENLHFFTLGRHIKLDKYNLKL